MASKNYYALIYGENMMRKGKQIAGEHYNSNTLSSPVTNVEYFRVVLVLSIIFRWANELVDVKECSCVGNLSMKTQST